ncbi:MAG: hypothetical protein ACD_80C00201G0001, partial [uncultured bacterium (gcode 4)]
MTNPVSTSFSLTPTAGNLIVGKFNPINPDYYLSGLIDELWIYNQALSSLEVQQLYQNWLVGGACDATILTITGSATTGGTITPTTAHVISGGNQTFVITANTGYQVADVLVDGSSVGAVTGYTFTNVITGHTISANFADITKPVLTLNDSSSITLEFGATYVDAGASALDN